MEKLSNILYENSITANKNLGQNFIFDNNILKKIAATIKQDSVCLEIGCGPGGLTRELSKICRKVIGIEIDSKFEPIYKKYISEENTQIIIDDFMKIDLTMFFEKYIGEQFSVCANLPYYITTPILMKLIDSNLPIDCINILVQKEVADRIVSPPNSKKYGRLSVMIQARGTARKLFDLSPQVFTPEPTVISTLIQIELQENQIKSNIDDFRICVKAAFSSRRKQLKNNLASYYGISKIKISEIFEEIDVKDTVRAENLSVEDFDALTILLNSNTK